jgi:hypothetical protein
MVSYGEWLPAAVNGNGPAADAWYPDPSPPSDLTQHSVRGVNDGDTIGNAYGPYTYQPRYGFYPKAIWNSSDISTTPAVRPKWPGPYLKEPDPATAPAGTVGWQLKDLEGNISPEYYMAGSTPHANWLTSGGWREYFAWYSQRWITGQTALESKITVVGDAPINPVQNNYIDSGTVPRLITGNYPVPGSSVPGAILHVVSGSTTSDYITPATVLTNYYANQLNGGGGLNGPFYLGQTNTYRVTTVGYMNAVMLIDLPPFTQRVIVMAARVRNRPDTTGGHCECAFQLELNFECPTANEFRWILEDTGPPPLLPVTPPMRVGIPTTKMRFTISGGR